MTIKPLTNEELETLFHVILTANTGYDYFILNHEQQDNEEWFNAIEYLPRLAPIYSLMNIETIGIFMLSTKLVGQILHLRIKLLIISQLFSS